MSAGNEDSPVAPVPARPVPQDGADGNTIGGDGSPIRLAALSKDDIDGAQLSGELACSFGAPGGAPLLLANGDVASSDPAQGVVKILDSVERVSAPGGFNGIVRGGTFTGQGKTIRITLIGDAPTAGGESPPHPATLTYERADGASRTLRGSWVCGP